MLSVFSSYHSSRICRVPFHSSNLVRIRHLAYPRSLCPSPLPSLALLDPAAYKIALYLTAYTARRLPRDSLYGGGGTKAEFLHAVNRSVVWREAGIFESESVFAVGFSSQSTESRPRCNSVNTCMYV